MKNKPEQHDDESFELPIMKGFPKEETFEDFAGNNRTFIISCHYSGAGYIMNAIEKGKDDGYEFSAYSETSPPSGVLRKKINRMLSTRHITMKEYGLDMTHGSMRGRIGYTFSGLALIVDGQPVRLNELAGILEMYEGWQFKLEIKDPNEDLLE